jgi:hypothetical protein
MSEVDLIEKRSHQYLDEVKAHLGELSPEEIDEVLDSVLSHIHNKMRERSEGAQTLHDLEEVLREMDPPEAYAQSVLHSPTQSSTRTRFSRYPIIGAILLPFGMGLALLFFPIFPSNTETIPTFWQWILRFTILPLGILAPFACTIIGLLGISEIRKSSGRVIGLPLSFFVTIFYPIIFLDLLLFWITASIFSSTDYWNIVFAMCIIIILVLDYVIIKAGWKVVNREQ